MSWADGELRLASTMGSDGMQVMEFGVVGIVDEICYSDFSDAIVLDTKSSAMALMTMTVGEGMPCGQGRTCVCVTFWCGALWATAKGFC